jgi:hypothetical protein
MHERQVADFFLAGAYDSTSMDPCGEENRRRGSFTSDSNHNLSEDDSAPGDDSLIDISEAALGTEMHLFEGSAARGAGLPLPGEPALARDIDEELRPTTGPWDIGADHYTATP